MKTSGAFLSEQSSLELEVTVRQPRHCTGVEGVSGQPSTWSPEAGGSEQHDPPSNRNIWGHLKWPETQKVSFQGRQGETKVFLTFYETFLQICSQRSRDPPGWRSWTGAGLPGLGTTAWRPATANGSECYRGRRLSAHPSSRAPECQG